jgi:hypothetical protein
MAHLATHQRGEGGIKADHQQLWKALISGSPQLLTMA